MLIQRLLARMGYEKKAPVAKTAPVDKKDPNPIVPIDTTDLDIQYRLQQMLGDSVQTPVDLKNYFKPVDEARIVSDNLIVADAEFKAGVVEMKAGDNCGGYSQPLATINTTPSAIVQWFARQTFPGYQTLALIAQHWLVLKACGMPGEDAVRHGFDLNLPDEEDATETAKKITKTDKSFRLHQNLVEANLFNNIFGIRAVLFLVDSDDQDYYEKPFNIDAVKKGCYKGISQIDPLWMAPVLSNAASRDPSSQDFYDPTWWIVQGRRIHKSHFVFLRGDHVADILKPTYLYGGVSLVQKIFEHVYDAERISAEAPRLAMAKRTTTLKVDSAKMAFNEQSFMKRLMRWIHYRDNFSVKVLGKDEDLQESDTSLGDLDTVIMGQYQIVAGVAKMPAFKLLGTSPKGFSTGDSELISYHEELETIQSVRMTPILERHYELLTKSMFGKVIAVEIAWRPVASMSAEQQATVNKSKVDSDSALVNIGAISPDEVRDRLRRDTASGYMISDEPEEVDPIFGEAPGPQAQTPEQAAQQTTASAKQTTAGAHVTQAGAAEQKVEGEVQQDEAPDPRDNPLIEQFLSALCEELVDSIGTAPGSSNDYRTAKPSVRGIKPTAEGIIKDIGWLKNEIQAHGLTFVIENAKGSYRSGTDMNGNKWRSLMPADYGFIKGIAAEDGDELDVFVGPNLENGKVFAITQNNPATGAFDEFKIMFGFDTPEQAETCYHAAYSPDWKGFGKIERVVK